MSRRHTGPGPAERGLHERRDLTPCDAPGWIGQLCVAEIGDGEQRPPATGHADPDAVMAGAVAGVSHVREHVGDHLPGLALSASKAPEIVIAGIVEAPDARTWAGRLERPGPAACRSGGSIAFATSCAHFPHSRESAPGMSSPICSIAL